MAHKQSAITGRKRSVAYINQSLDTPATDSMIYCYNKKYIPDSRTNSIAAGRAVRTIMQQDHKVVSSGQER